MRVLSIRRVTNDSNHNAFTGACWFQGALYVAFRQGDAHVCTQGRLVVMRSRNEGASFDIVATIRGEFDTRDAHLYSNGDKRLFVAGFEHSGTVCYPGAAWTDDGIHWSGWTRYKGDVANTIFWRPRCFAGRFYCAAYHSFNLEDERYSAVSWFEGKDGITWQKKHTIHKGADQPNECSLDFKPDGSAAMIMRREHKSRMPLLLHSAPPYRKWSKTELNIPLAGPALWFAGDDIWISGRWFLTPQVTHVGVFKIEKNKPVLRLVLPSGPGFDCSYMGVGRRTDNQRRLSLSYYSGHTAPDDPAVDQWSHPDIYVADITFGAAFIERWKVSDVIRGSLADAACPNPSAGNVKWYDMKCTPENAHLNAHGFVDAHGMIRQRPGLVYFVSDIEIGPCDSGHILLGYDGPVRAWLNGKQIFEGPGTNPAYEDRTSIPVSFKHGTNRLAIALDTNGGKAWGIFARYELAQTVR